MHNPVLNWLRNNWRSVLQLNLSRLFLWAPVLLAFGVAGYLALPFDPAIYVVAGAAVAFVLLGFGLIHLTHHRQWLLLLLPVAGFALAGIEQARLNTMMLQADLGVRQVQGVLLDIEPRPDGQRLVLGEVKIAGLTPEATPQKIRLTDKKTQDKLPVGAEISLTALLRQMPTPTRPGGYDFRQHAFFDGIGGTGFVVQAPKIISLPEERDWQQAFANARNGLRQTIQATLQGDEAAITEALLTGAQQGISAPTLEAMRVSGLAHILSVSGLHIGLAAGIIFLVVRLLLALSPWVTLHWPIKKLAAGAAFMAALAYTLFVGAPVPAQRALLMTGLMLLAVMTDRTAFSLRVVALAAIAVLVVQPSALLGASFQLSFAAVVVIIAAYEQSRDWRAKLAAQEQSWLLRALLYVGAIAATSILVGAITAPLTHYHFQQLSLYGVIANALAMPLTSFMLMPLALLAFALMPFGLAAYPLALLGIGMDWLMAIAHWVASLPGAEWRPSGVAFGAMLAFVLGALWLVIMQGRVRWIGLVPMLAYGWWAVFMPPAPLALIAADGSYVLLRDAARGAYVVVADKSTRRYTGFTLEDWQDWLGSKNLVRADESLLCDAGACATGDVVVLRDAAALAEICAERPLVLISLNTRPPRDCAEKIINYFSLQDYGAAAVEQGGKISFVYGDQRRAWEPVLSRPLQLPPAHSNLIPKGME